MNFDQKHQNATRIHQNTCILIKKHQNSSNTRQIHQNSSKYMNFDQNHQKDGGVSGAERSFGRFGNFDKI